MTGQQHGAVFPFPSIGVGGVVSWQNRSMVHPVASLNPPSALSTRVASAVTEIQDWWRDQLIASDDSDEESR